MYKLTTLSLVSTITVVGLFGCKKAKDSGFFKNHTDINNFIAGGVAGFISGNIVGPIEAAKVKLQVSSKYTGLYSILKNDWRALLKAALPFGLTFSCVCALEFSVNHNIGEKYGKFAGIVASAATGSAFLTPIDHIIFRMDKGQTPCIALKQLYSNSLSTVWTGFAPMFFREAAAIINVMIAGPMLGSFMKKASGLENDSSKDNLFWNTLGRYPASLIGTFISHPFDTLARELQKEVYAKLDYTPKISQVLSKMEFNQYWKGLAPRMMLAPIGLTIAGSGFDFFSNKLDSSNDDDEYLMEPTKLPKLSLE